MATFDARWKNPQSKDLEALWRWAQDITRELRKGDYLGGAIPGTGIANAQLADMAAGTIKMRNAATTGEAQDVLIGDLDIDPDPTDPADYLLGAEIGTDALRRFQAQKVGGLQLLNSGTVSNAATLDIVLTSFTGYRGLRFVLSSFVPASDDVELWMRLSTNGGSSYDATGYSRVLIVGHDSFGQAFCFNSGSDTKIAIAGSATAGESVSNVAAEGGASVIVDIFDHTNTGRWPSVNVVSSNWFGASVTNSFTASGTGRRENAQNTDAVRFLFESGNIASGNWALYGDA